MEIVILNILVTAGRKYSGPNRAVMHVYSKAKIVQKLNIYITGKWPNYCCILEINLQAPGKMKSGEGKRSLDGFRMINPHRMCPFPSF